MGMNAPQDRLNAENPADSVEQSQETVEAPAVVSRSEFATLQELAAPLLAGLREVPDGDLVGDLIATALKLLRDQTNRGDLKLITRSLKELRYALTVFAPYHEVRKVSIFGSARTPETHPDYEQALSFAQRMVQAGWMVLTGAGGGIMAAGHGGAGADPSFGLAIRLPFEQGANPFITGDPKLIHFRYFFTRKVMFLRASDAVAVFPGGVGTMDEAYEVLTLLQTGRAVPRPVVFIDSPGMDYWRPWQEYVERQLLARGLIGPDDLRLYRVTDSVDEAVGEITRFYVNFHSIRYTPDQTVLRLRRRPSQEQLAEITALFSDISSGEFRAAGPLPVESDEPGLAGLHRLVFPFNRRDYARLRMLIDHLNDLPPAAT
jgi:uncharacterized protein (TIGR00730 family)